MVGGRMAAMHRPADPGKFHQLMHGLTASNGGALIVAETVDGTRLA